MRVLQVAIHLASALAVLSSSIDLIKNQIIQGQWREVPNENSTEVVDKAVTLTDQMSDRLKTHQLRHEPVKTSIIREASTARFVVGAVYNSLGCKSFYEASINKSGVCMYSAVNSYSTYMTIVDDTSYTTKYYRDKFCESSSYKNETKRFQNICVNTYKGTFASSTPVVSFDRSYIAIR